VAGVKAALGLSGLFADLERDDARAKAPRPLQPEASAAGATAPGSRRPVERGRRPDDVPHEVYDNLPEANR
jgi:hypothetical protein